ncbi:hypothetical protein SAMN02910353_00523 [Ruminococcus sp. YRD2003]|uniref:hypothetical protein n=1 Tax=Ruminococcus sp. YRD2003 TaxID=1452313 RepID=UPI0008BE2F30|nr:hypothetical protein SAMN02910353_00523 [Ruminococcus flavefaciens]
MEKKMKTVSILMSLFMGVTLSFCLSLLGNLLAEGGFKPIVFIVSFIVSTLISLVIGFVVPMRKISTAITKNMKPRSIGAKLVDALVSDLIYTPVITLVMIVLVRFMANKMSGGHAQLPPFAVMFLSSLVISLVAAFVIILIVTPLFMKLSLKLAGVPAGGPPSGRRE